MLISSRDKIDVTIFYKITTGYFKHRHVFCWNKVMSSLVGVRLFILIGHEKKYAAL